MVLALPFAFYGTLVMPAGYEHDPLLFTIVVRIYVRCFYTSMPFPICQALGGEAPLIVAFDEKQSLAIARMLRTLCIASLRDFSFSIELLLSFFI